MPSDLTEFTDNKNIARQAEQAVFFSPFFPLFNCKFAAPFYFASTLGVLQFQQKCLFLPTKVSFAMSLITRMKSIDFLGCFFFNLSVLKTILFTIFASFLQQHFSLFSVWDSSAKSDNLQILNWVACLLEECMCVCI